VCYDDIAYSTGRARRSDGVIVCLSHCSKIVVGHVYRQRRLVAGFWTRRPLFDPRAVLVVLFVVNKVELGQTVLESSVSLSIIIPQILHIYSSSHLGINCGPTRHRSSTEICLTPPQEKQYKKCSYNIYFIIHYCILICLLSLYCYKSNNSTWLFFLKCCSN